MYFTPVERLDYRIGVPYRCVLKPVLASNCGEFGGYGFTPDPIKTDTIPCDGFEQSANLHIPPMSAVFYKLTYVKK